MVPLTDQRIANLQGIGPFLTSDEASTLATAILTIPNEEKALVAAAQGALLNEYLSMSEPSRVEVREHAAFWDAEFVTKLKQREARLKAASASGTSHSKLAIQ